MSFFWDYPFYFLRQGLTDVGLATQSRLLTNRPQKFTCLCFIRVRIVNAHHHIPLLQKDFIFIILVMCVCVCACVQVCAQNAVRVEARRGHWSFEAGVRGRCELPNVSAGRESQALWKAASTIKHGATSPSVFTFLLHGFWDSNLSLHSCKCFTLWVFLALFLLFVKIYLCVILHACVNTCMSLCAPHPFRSQGTQKRV